MRWLLLFFLAFPLCNVAQSDSTRTVVTEKEMREAGIHTPVLMVSSSNHPRRDLSRMDASELIQAFIPKPLTIEKLETYLSDS